MAEMSRQVQLTACCPTATEAIGYVPSTIVVCFGESLLRLSLFLVFLRAKAKSLRKKVFGQNIKKTFWVKCIVLNQLRDTWLIRNVYKPNYWAKTFYDLKHFVAF